VKIYTDHIQFPILIVISVDASIHLFIIIIIIIIYYYAEAALKHKIHSKALRTLATIVADFGEIGDSCIMNHNTYVFRAAMHQA